ncbi:hypothetical protein DM819_06640 [Pseudomonas hunanensis]|uniref:Integrase n=1 Tax=Pseudomonas hunanensis TaxID=1247546 RepID=A0ABD6NA39_9PSED|nr:hypothetical protein [Pseudomonas hunanensis]NWL45552.1 hypothetical protein [Pseudomonas hunanensis]
MRYLSMYNSELSAISSDGKVISASYVEHPMFSFMDELCCGFHYVYMKYVPTASYSQGYALRSAIRDFLNFRQLHNNRLHPDLHLKRMEHFGVEHFNLFKDHLIRKGQTLYAARSLRASLLKVARENDDGFPLLVLPGVKISTVQREPLDERANAEFNSAMRNTVAMLKRKLEFRSQVEMAEPYTSQEVCSLIPLLMDSANTGFKWVIDPARALRTLFDVGYPFNTTSLMAASLRNDLQEESLVRNITKPSDFVLCCCLSRGFYVLRKYTPQSMSFPEMIRLYYPTCQDQSSLALFIQRQTGWNKESVILIDKDNFLHPLSEVTSSGVVLVISEKKKSQSKRRNTEVPKTVKALSGVVDECSPYNLIVLAKELSEPLGDIVLNSKKVALDDNLRRTVFLCLPEKDLDWCASDDPFEKRVNSIGNQRYWNIGVAGFLEENDIIDGGIPLESATDLEGRLRVTWEYYYEKETKHPLSMIALRLGHADLETTSAHYDSSVKAMNDRKDRYRGIQEELIGRFKSGQFQGLIASTHAKPTDPTFRIFTIIGHLRALWACIDSSKPDYPDAPELAVGERCSRLDKCLFCSRIYILGDSLPFLVERLSTLQRAVDADEARHAHHQGEIEILEYLINNWRIDSAMADALVYMRAFEALLPYDMRSLIAYIED